MNWILWALLSAIFAAFTAILAKLGVSTVEPNLATAIRTSVIVVLAWGIVAFVGSHTEIVKLDRRSVTFLVASGLATGLSWLCYFRALSLGPASKVAPLDKLSVVFVILLAWPLLNEPINKGKLIGGTLLTAGAIVIALAK